MPERIQRIHEQLDNLYAQVEAAKVESGKPFAQEAELAQKSARLVALTAELNMDRPSLDPEADVPVKRKRYERDER